MKRPKVRMMAPLVQAQRPRAYVPNGRAEAERARNDQSWRRWYQLVEWKALRRACLQRDNWTCGLCGRVCVGRGEAVADHRVPHRGVRVRFFDLANLWCLCKACHDSEKQRQERRDGLR